jgi:hypothetical protein
MQTSRWTLVVCLSIISLDPLQQFKLRWRQPCHLSTSCTLTLFVSIPRTICSPVSGLCSRHPCSPCLRFLGLAGSEAGWAVVLHRTRLDQLSAMFRHCRGSSSSRRIRQSIGGSWARTLRVPTCALSRHGCCGLQIAIACYSKHIAT